MIMQYKALIWVVLVLINNQYASQIQANKQLVNSQYVFPNLNITLNITIKEICETKEWIIVHCNTFLLFLIIYTLFVTIIIIFI